MKKHAAIMIVGLVGTIMILLIACGIYFFSRPPMYPTADDVVHAEYTWYLSCIKQYGTMPALLYKQCAFNTPNALAESLAKKIQSVSFDPIFCMEGIPDRMVIDAPYFYGKIHATSEVITHVKDAEYHIPVRTEKTQQGWKIVGIDCDLDGHID